MPGPPSLRRQIVIGAALVVLLLVVGLAASANTPRHQASGGTPPAQTSPLAKTSPPSVTPAVTDSFQPTRAVTVSTLTGHTDMLLRVAFSPNGRTLATTSGDKTAKLWDVSDPAHPTLTATLTGSVDSVAFSPNGRTLATANEGDGMAKLWDVSDPIHPTLTATLTGHTGWVFGVAFSPNGRTLATASGDKTAKLWSLS